MNLRSIPVIGKFFGAEKPPEQQEQEEQIQQRLKLEKLTPRSRQWPTFRKNWLRTHPECAACGTKSFLEVHHIIPVHINSAKELDASNVITLCQQPSHDCHYHLGHLLDWKAYNPTCTQDSAAFKHAVLMRPYTIPPTF